MSSIDSRIRWGVRSAPHPASLTLASSVHLDAFGIIEGGGFTIWADGIGGELLAMWTTGPCSQMEWEDRYSRILTDLADGEAPPDGWQLSLPFPEV